jgi:serine/threonine protein kinase
MTTPLLTPTLGPFRLLRRIGAGGMAETFLAERSGPAGVTQKVCLKTILAEPSNMELLLRSFENEMRIGAKLRHNALVQQLDCGIDGDTLWIALEFIEGVDLRKLINALKRSHGGLPTRLVPYVICEVLGALDYVHRLSEGGRPLRIVHRDVSPANVLLSTEGEVKLADFGIARAYAEIDGVQTTTGMLKGKIPYMSPEQARGAPLDARSDLFTMGTMAFELFARVRPFDGDSELATLVNVRDGQGKSLRELAPSLDPWVYDFVARLLEPDPSHRFQTAAEAIRAIPTEHVTRVHRGELAALVADATTAPKSAASMAPVGAATPAPDDATLLSTETLAPVPEHDSSTVIFDRGPPLTRTSAFDGASELLAHPVASVARPIEPAAPLVRESKSGPGKKGITFAAVAAALIGVSGWVAVRTMSGASSAAENAAPVSSNAARQSAPLAPPPPSPPSPPSPPPPTPPPAPPPPRPSEAVVASPEPPEPVEAPAQAATEAAPAAVEERALLRVQAVPWGSVWIDGQRAGEGTVRRQLTPGRHVVAVGLDAPGPSRTVTLRPGEDKSVSMRVN